MSTDCKQASNLRQPSETLRDDVKQLAISRQCFFCDYCGAYLGHKITQAHFDTSRHISTHVRHIGVDWSTHMCRKCVDMCPDVSTQTAAVTAGCNVFFPK